MSRKRKAGPPPVKEDPVDDRAGSPDEDMALSGPPTIDPYVVLQISATATPGDVKSAYRKLALAHHPDKVPAADRAAAHQKFQEIAFAYAILSDERRRRRYDATGNTAETLNVDDDDFDWVDFFRAQSANVVSGEMIAQVKREYQGSEEERDDVLSAYRSGQGDMDAVFEAVMCSDVDADYKRFRQLIDEAIAQGEVKAYDKYNKETTASQARRRARATKEADEAAEYARELGLDPDLLARKPGSKASKKSKTGADDTDALQALIQQRQKARSQNFLDDLEAKYGGGAAKKGQGQGKRQAIDEPPEEAFERNAKKGKKAKKGAQP